MSLPANRRGLHSGMRFGWLIVSATAIAAASFGCSGGDKTGDTANPVGGSGGSGGSDTDALVSCTMDPRVDTYTANLKKDGQLKMLTFTLVESTPAPPIRGSNVMKLKVTKADG